VAKGGKKRIKCATENLKRAKDELKAFELGLLFSQPFIYIEETPIE
jgi:hypothetical protein